MRHFLSAILLCAVAMGTGFTQIADSALYASDLTDDQKPKATDEVVGTDVSECGQLGSPFKAKSRDRNVRRFEYARPYGPSTNHSPHRGTTKEPPTALLT